MVRSSPQQFIEEKKKRHGGLEEKGGRGSAGCMGKKAGIKGAELVAKMRSEIDTVFFLFFLK